MVRKRIPFDQISTVIGGDLNRIARASILELFSRTVYNSVVGDADFWKSKPPPGYVGGRYRGSWGVEFQGYAETRDVIDPGGSATFSDGAAKMANYRVGLGARIVNNTVYSLRLEFEDHSPRMIGGNVQKRAMEWQGIVADIVRAKNGKGAP